MGFRSYKYTISGALIGLMALIFIWVVEMGSHDLPISLSSLQKIHNDHIANWVLDLLPVLLGVSFYFFDRRYIEAYGSDAYFVKNLGVWQKPENFRRFFENASIGLSITSVDGIIREVNPKFCEIFGYTRDELLNMHVSALDLPEDQAQNQEDREKVLSSRKSKSASGRKLRKNGSVMWAKIARDLVKDEHGKPLYFIAQTQDITEQKKAEDSLRESEARFKDFARAGADRYWETDRQHHYIYLSELSETATQTRKYPVEKVLGHTRWAHETGEELTLGSYGLKEIMDRHEPFKDFVYRRENDNGEVYYVGASGVPLFDEDDKFTGYRGINRTVTREIEALDKVEKVQQQFYNAMDNSPDGVVLWSADDRLIMANKKFLSEQENSNMPVKPGTHYRDFLNFIVNEFHSLEDKDAWIDKQFKLHKSGTANYELRRGDQTLLIKKSKLSDGSVISFQTDITKIKQREEEALLARHEADAANKAKSVFLSSMSHELRTPLNAILGFTQLLNMNFTDAKDDMNASYVDQIYESGEFLLELMNQILNLSQIESGSLEINCEKVAPADVVDEAIHMMESRAVENNIILDNKLSDSCPLFWTDRMRFRQIIINLMSNAVKYNVTGGKVTIENEDGIAGFSRIKVIDTGPGISKDQQAGLFQPFNRLGRENGEVEGSGIGLTIVKELSNHLGGQIGFESEEGIGSIFWIELPIVQADRDNVADEIILKV